MLESSLLIGREISSRWGFVTLSGGKQASDREVLEDEIKIDIGPHNCIFVI
jgi:hypothetical protein